MSYYVPLVFVVSFRRPLLNVPVRWRHNGHDGVSNHQPHDCLLNHLFRHISKKTSELRVAGLCSGNSPVTGEFPAQRASNPEKVCIWCCHHEFQPGSWPMSPLGAGDSQQWSKHGYFTHQVLFCSQAKYNYTNTVVMNIWNVDAQQKHTYISGFFMSVSNNYHTWFLKSYFSRRVGCS